MFGSLMHLSGARQALLRVFGTRWQWILLAQFASAAGTWAVVKSVSNLTDVAGFGRFGIILAVAFAVNTLLFGPLAAWAQRHFQEAREQGAHHAYYRALGYAVLICTVVGGVVPLVAATFLTRPLARVGLTLGSVAVGLALGLIMSYSDTAIAITNAAFKRRSAAAFLVVGTWIRVLAVITAWLVGARSATAYAASIALALALLVVVQVRELARDRRSWSVPPREPRSFLPSLREFMLPLVIWGLPGYVLSFGDRLLLAYFTGPSLVGVYVAMTAATVNVGYTFSAAANRVLEPAIYLASGAGVDAERVRRAHRVIRLTTLAAVVLSVPLLVVYALWPKPIIAFFSSGKYATHAGYLWVLLLSTVVFLLGQQLMLHGLVVKRPWVYVPIKFVHAGALATGLVLLVPRYGLAGVVWALLAAHSLQLLMVVGTNRVRLGVRTAERGATATS